MSSAGNISDSFEIKLIPKQIEAYKALTDMDNGITEVLFGGGARGGKMLSINELVCTPFGFRKVKDLKVGDIITSAETGGQQRITYIHPMGTFEFYRVSFNDGTYVDCSEGHLWQVHVSRKSTKRKDEEGNSKNQRVWETTQIRDWLLRQERDGINKGKHLLIPLCKPVQFTTGQSRYRYIDPYVLGVLIGDGCLSRKSNYVSVTTPDEFIVNKIMEKGFSVKKHETPYKACDDYSIKGEGLDEGLANLGLKGHTAKTKFIPNVYKYAPIDTRKALMCGLMDTDGYVDDRGHMSYTTISKQLAEDVAFIIRSLGGKATVTKGKAGYKKDGEYHRCNDAYDVTFTCSLAKELVSLPKKLERVRDFYPRQCAGKQIVSVTPIGKRRSRCISVDDVSGLYVTKDFTVTHNSYLGCLWQILNRLKYPRSAGMIGRYDFVTLQNTTLVTFFEVLASLPECYQKQIHYKASVPPVVEFANGSVIYIVYFKDRSKDPNFDRFGSYAITDLFIDESQEISAKLISVLRGRFSLLQGFYADGTRWQTKPKALYTCNPSRGWNYTDFYRPYREGTLVPYRKFIQSLPADNPHVTQDYIDNLMRADKVTVQRLVYGNFEYDDDPSTLCDYDAISELFTNKRIQPVGRKSISADIATKGHDKFIVGSWYGNVVYIAVDKSFSPGKEIETEIRRVQAQENVPSRYIIVDSDGVGNFLSSYMPGIREFHGGARPADSKFANLRSECYFKLADMINNRRLRIVCTPEQRELIKDELAVIRQAFIDNDTKKKTIISKEEMKKLLGRSPDYADMLMMGMWFRRASITSGAKLKVLHNRG